MKLAAYLEQTPQFLLGIDPSLVCASLKPNNALFVKIWLIQPLRHYQCNDHAFVGKENIFCLNGQWTAH